MKGLNVGLMNERRKSHDSFWFIHDDYNDKVKD